MVLILLSGCSEKLDLKPNAALVLPATIKDFESMLDNTAVMNKTCALGHLSADEYFISSRQNWEALTNAITRTAYLWEPDLFEGKFPILDWDQPYAQVYYCNSVLDLLPKQKLGSEADRIKGWALFNRAYAFYTLVSTFAKGYDPSTADSDLGIPLKLTSGITELVQRHSVEECYSRIIKDLTEASGLLQTEIPAGKKNRPSKVAAFAMLARVFLSMRIYDQAEVYADKSMALYATLIDYNTLIVKPGSSFSYNSEETIYFSQQGDISYGQITSPTGALGGIDTLLIQQYDQHDLKKNIYFGKHTNGNYFTKGINSPVSYPFTGLATDEIYLIKAECLARRSQIQSAMDLLNQLASKRWNPNASAPAKPYVNIVAVNAEDALNKVLLERRKTLVWRGLRWTDIKRLNLAGSNIILKRQLNGETFVLQPNSPLYVMPIPDKEILLSGLKQNIR